MSGIWMSIALAALLAGCATQKLSGDQLARVAKDWSLSIRASQVIPVYPFTEDLQPGDVFLVQTPIDEQVQVYLDKGFLPLENLVTRLTLSGYPNFYRGWPHVTDDDTAPPRLWQFPSPIGAAADFSSAPLAAFPTYGFSVSRSEGLNLALPVQGVPIGLNLLDSASANGTIAMKDAYTYALPTRWTFDAIRSWSLANADYLRQFEPISETTKNGKSVTKQFYLRVVNRVYMVKTVDIALFSNGAFGASGSAGVPKGVELLNLANATEAAKQLDAVNGIISKASSPKPGDDSGAATGSGDAGGAPILAGGSVKIALATSRSISLVETFRRPLVVGYLASDYQILPGGQLAAPVPTRLRLEGKALIAGQAIKYDGCDPNCKLIRTWRKLPGNKQKLEDWLAKHGGIAIADLETGPYGSLRERVAEALIDTSE
jgi:hypothetical protein